MVVKCPDCGVIVEELFLHKVWLRECSIPSQAQHDGHVDCDCLTPIEREGLLAMTRSSPDYQHFYAPKVPR